MNILCNNLCCSQFDSWKTGGRRDVSRIMNVHRGNDNIKYCISALGISISISGTNIYTTGGFAPSPPPLIPYTNVISRTFGNIQ